MRRTAAAHLQLFGKKRVAMTLQERTGAEKFSRNFSRARGAMSLRVEAIDHVRDRGMSVYHPVMNTPRKASARISAKQPDDDLLLQRIGKERDQAAFEELFRRHTDHAFNLALNITGNSQHAEDAVQEAFLSVWTHAANYHPGNAKAWILGIVAKKGMHMNRRKGELAAAIEERLQPSDPSESTADRMDKDELLDAMRELIWKLPQRERAMVALHYGAGMTQGEVARELGMPARTLSTRLASVLGELREKLAAAGLGAALPLVNENGLCAAVTTGHPTPAGLAARVARGVISEACRQSIRAAGASSLTPTLFLTVASVAVLGGGTALYVASQNGAPAEKTQTSAAIEAHQTPSAPEAAAAPKHKPVDVSYSFDKGIPEGIRILRGKWIGWLPPKGTRKGALMTTVSATDGVAFEMPVRVPSNLVKVHLKVFVPEDVYRAHGLTSYSACVNVTWPMPRKRIDVQKDVLIWRAILDASFPRKLERTYTIYLFDRNSVLYWDGHLSTVVQFPLKRSVADPLAFCIGGFAVESISIKEIKPKDLPEECRDPAALIEMAKAHPETWRLLQSPLFTFQPNDEPVRLDKQQTSDKEDVAP